MKSGKHVHNEMRVRWYCCNCWQRGEAAIAYSKGNFKPTLDEIHRMVKMTCHTDCSKPEIKFVH